MKIVFVHQEMDSLGVEYLSAFLKQGGHEVELVFDPLLFKDVFFNSSFLHRKFSFRKIIAREVASRKPGLVCFSVATNSNTWACETAREIKKHIDVPIVFGGIHPTSVPESVIKNSFVDFMVVGEGEHALLELANAIESGKPTRKIMNVWSRKGRKIYRNPVRPLVEDLDSLPFPDKSIFSNIVPAFFDRYTTITSRGCPFSCTYCNNSFMKKIYKGRGIYHRRRSVDSVIEELRLAKRAGFREVIFHDETFNHNPAWLREFSAKYRKHINLPFFCWINPSMVNEEAVNLLRRAGCVRVEMGVQTHNQEIASSVLRRRCSERETENAIRLLKAAGIYITTDNMVDLPGQREEDILKMIDFYNRNRVNFAHMFWLKYLPQTEIVNISKKMGIVDGRTIKLMNEGIMCSHITRQGRAMNKRFGKMVNFFLFLNIFPDTDSSNRFIKFLTRKKAYRLFPYKDMNFLITILFRITSIFIKEKKLRIKLGNRRLIPFYLHFMSKRLSSRL